MIPSDKPTLYRELKEEGVLLEKPYPKLTVPELQEAYRSHFGKPVETRKEAEVRRAKSPAASNIPVDELAGLRANAEDPEEILRVDEQGRKWIQEEIRKATTARPRGRRVLKYRDPGVLRKEVVQDGRFEEAFEIAGNQDQLLEHRITLPSYQVGIYMDPRFPWRVLQYLEALGFHYDDIVEYYGGKEFIPASIKKVYVDRMLCFDIPSTIRTVQEEARRLRLA